ncbi:transporter [Pandoraea terrae]|uniref:Transporter n=1 Tax=Pandoraea terrae TaxID=1537710 RepID=A0A5E4SFY0_9BURK|nr:sodium-dependent transporter [Pandoraea terrae]VVD72919.1 transporter [Pandoraea terrae]
MSDISLASSHASRNAAEPARAGWGSRAGFVLAAAGSAVGLGAVWKFPYVVGKHGGGAFLLVYLASVFTLGLALLLAEMTIGRLTGRSATTAFRMLGGRAWAWAGRISALNAFLILAFYCVVGGWTIAYLLRSITGEALVADTARLHSQFNTFIADPWEALAFAGLFLVATAVVVIGGVQKGIERAGKILMPALFVLMLMVIARSLTLPGAMDGVAYFLMPDFAQLSGESLLQALGLAFFSLSLGAGIIIAYGSYLPKDAPLVSSCVWVGSMATLACLLAGLMVLPAVFAFGLPPDAGPGLTFIAMPAIFAQMPFGHAVAIAFFLLLLFAALTSSVSLLEPVVAFLIDEYAWPRRRAVVVVAIATFVAGIPAALSFGAWKDVEVFGRSLFDIMDYTAMNIGMPLGGLFVAALVSWRIWPQARTVLGGMRARWLVPTWRGMCLVLTPIAVLAIWYQNL